MQSLPTALAPMGQYAQFLLYKLVSGKTPGKTDKIPIDPRTCMSYPKGGDWQNDPTATVPFKSAQFLAAQLGEEYGVGFLFSNRDPFFFLDIDNALVDGAWSELATYLCGRFQGAAIELSQSGRGLHIFGRYSALPVHSNRNDGMGLEFYTEKRFAALTGINAIGSADADCTQQLLEILPTYFLSSGSGNPDQDWTTEAVPEYTGPENDEELIAKASAVKSAAGAFGDKCTFVDLWTADADALGKQYPDSGTRAYDASAADAALAQHLAFWTGKNCERIKRLMLQSELAREKWDREDYLPRTITRAVGLQTQVYSAGATASSSSPLQGTPKQIAYAETIQATRLLERPEAKDLIYGLQGPAAEARFWIDTQADPIDSVLTTLTPIQNASNPMTLRHEAELTEGYQFLGASQQVEHFQGCVYIQDAHKVFTPTGALLKPEQFNATYGGYDFEASSSGKSMKKAFEAFTSSQLLRFPKVESTCFRPLSPSGQIIFEAGRSLVNTYVPVETPRRTGDPEPFLKQLRVMLPDKHDQEIILAYLAALVQYKGVKFQWAPLIQGAEGNGKSLLTRCILFAMGDRYTHLPLAQEIAEKFNSWLFGRLFIGVEDIYVPNHKLEVIEVLKPMITNDRMSCRAMQRAQETLDNCANFIFNTNYQDGLRKTKSDRRFATFFCAQQSKDDINRDGMGAGYFPKLYRWAKEGGGYAIVNDFLHRYEIPDELNPAGNCDRAPDTSTTHEAIAAGMGSVEQEILEAIDEGRPGFAGGWVSSTALEMLLKQMRREVIIPPNKRRGILKALGYDWHLSLNDGRVNNPVYPDGKKPRLFIKKGHIHCNLDTPKKVAAAYEEAQRRALESSSFNEAQEAFSG